MTTNNIDDWLQKIGPNFLRDIGLKKDHNVLEFGCGSGDYTIPSSLVIGEKGTIYSFDKNKDALDNLKQKIREKGMKNIKLIKSEDTINNSIQNNSIDMVLLYDVLHLLKDRKKLLNELYQVTKIKGILSVYPKHHDTDMKMSYDDIIKEIEFTGFQFEKKLLKKLVHDSKLEKGYILNFRK